MTADDLSAEQRRVALLPHHARALVSAGPGTGKTHLLVFRVQALLGQGLTAAEILVLSFSRAAVGEIESRLRSMAGDESFVRAKTLDSLALRLIALQAMFNQSELPALTTFDERIECATAFLRADVEAATKALGFRHLIVDEVQDVVGIRCDFVISLLGLKGVGFTLLGDRAQGIYDFQMAAEERLLERPRFYEAIQQAFGSGIQRFSLETNYRLKAPNRRLADLGLRLCEDGADFELLSIELERMVARLLSVGNFDRLSEMLNNQGTHALLCATGGEALYLSRELRRRGIAHSLNSNPQERHWSRWIVDVLRALPSQSISWTRFADSYPETATQCWLIKEAAWRELRRIAGSRGRYLDMRDVVGGMRAAWLSDSVGQAPRSKVTVSNVHRAKGLEFGTVYIYDEPHPGMEPFASDRARRLFVALTRTRGKTFRIPKQSWAPIVRDTIDDRWRVPHFNRFATMQLEVTAEDSLDSLFPPGGTHGLAAETQEYLENTVQPNDPVYLRRVTSIRGDSRADYEVVHCDRVIGLVSGNGIDSGLQRIRNSRDRTWELPLSIDDLFVSSIEATAGLPNAAQQCGLGNTDVWLKASIVGLGQLQWHRAD